MDWVLAQRLRTIVIAVVAAPLLSVVSAALIALETARRGVTSGTVCGLGAIVGLLLLAFLARTDAAWFGVVGLVCAGTGVGIGALIRRAGNLMLAYQAAVLISLVAVGAVGLLGLNVRALFEPAISEMVALLQANQMPPEAVAFIERRSPSLLFAVYVFSQLIGSLLLGYWWSSLAAGQRRFGHEFRRLALGRLMGTVATALLVLGLVFGWELVQNLMLLALLGFLVQGASVVHAWAHAKRWHPALLAPLYVLLLTPFNVIVVVPLGIVGLVDNWFDLRASLRAQA